MFKVSCALIVPDSHLTAALPLTVSTSAVLWLFHSSDSHVVTTCLRTRIKRCVVSIVNQVQPGTRTKQNYKCTHTTACLPAMGWDGAQIGTNQYPPPLAI